MSVTQNSISKESYESSDQKAHTHTKRACDGRTDWESANRRTGGQSNPLYMSRLKMYFATECSEIELKNDSSQRCYATPKKGHVLGEGGVYFQRK